MISNTVMSLDLENRQQLPIFDGCSPNIVFLVALPGAQLVLNDLYTYIIFFIAKSEEISKKLDDRKKRVLESFGANLPYYYLFLVFLHQFCETYSTKQLETSQYDIEHFFGGNQ